MLTKFGVKVVSISGAKGKRMIPPDEYESDVYRKCRNDRSAVESLMFTIKHNYDFGEVMRAGLENVRAELLEQVLVYNFFRVAGQRNRTVKAAA